MIAVVLDSIHVLLGAHNKPPTECICIAKTQQCNIPYCLYTVLKRAQSLHKRMYCTCASSKPMTLDRKLRAKRISDGSDLEHKDGLVNLKQKNWNKVGSN